MMQKEDLRIVFMGTPEFAAESLKKLIESNYQVVGVITVPDKPAGRGLKMQASAVKEVANSAGIPVLQPERLKDAEFIEELRSLRANIQVVVAFRMLPEMVWAMPKFGTFNLHASLLPEYRGAAPINHAIINGETRTGITTFFIDQHIDTGNIAMSEVVEIEPEMTAGELHDLLMVKGANLVCKTLDTVIAGNLVLTHQDPNGASLKMAPKIFKDDCRINWNKDAKSIHNLIRGLSPYPAAWSLLSNSTNEIHCKIFRASYEQDRHNTQPGTISHSKNEMKVAVIDGYIEVLEIQLSGKKRMSVTEFLKGFDLTGYSFLP